MGIYYVKLLVEIIGINVDSNNPGKAIRVISDWGNKAETHRA